MVDDGFELRMTDSSGKMESDKQMAPLCNATTIPFEAMARWKALDRFQAL